MMRYTATVIDMVFYQIFAVKMCKEPRKPLFNNNLRLNSSAHPI